MRMQCSWMQHEQQQLLLVLFVCEILKLTLSLCFGVQADLIIVGLHSRLAIRDQGLQTSHARHPTALFGSSAKKLGTNTKSDIKDLPD